MILRIPRYLVILFAALQISYVITFSRSHRPGTCQSSLWNNFNKLRAVPIEYLINSLVHLFVLAAGTREMATEDGQEPGSWVFITTSPTSIRPSKAQRSQMRQRVMREIGYSRRKVRLPSRKEQLAGSESRFKTPPKPQGSDEITYSPRSQASSASIAKSQSGDFNNYPDGSSYKTFLPPSIGALLTCPTTLENDSRSIFYHSMSICPSFISNAD